MLEQFLELVLENWNGDVYRKEVFQLSSHISLQPFDSEEEEEEEEEYMSYQCDWRVLPWLHCMHDV